MVSVSRVWFIEIRGDMKGSAIGSTYNLKFVRKKLFKTSDLSHITQSSTGGLTLHGGQFFVTPAILQPFNCWWGNFSQGLIFCDTGLSAALQSRGAYFFHGGDIFCDTGHSAALHL